MIGYILMRVNDTDTSQKELILCYTGGKSLRYK